MSVSKLKQVMWVIRETYPRQRFIRRQELRPIIMRQCGTSPKTYTNNLDALLRLGWLRRVKWRFEIVGDDLEE